MERWAPADTLTRQEQFIMKRLDRVKKLFGFLRIHRLRLFDDGFQDELAKMYRDSGAGKSPRPPAMMAMVVLLQAYCQISDAEAVELSVMDLRWQMVLGCLGATEPAFSQGALQAFRERLVATDMDRRLLERTVALARETKEFDFKKLPKTVRLGVDSSPFEGAGRVEDTFNLLGHAARSMVQIAAKLLERPVEDVIKEAGIPVLLAPSIKAGLDTDWSRGEMKEEALRKLVAQIENLQQWCARYPFEVLTERPLARYIEALRQVKEQNLCVNDNGVVEMVDGVAKNRRISIEDADMRHGRKSQSKTFNGFRRHLGHDLDSGLILACAITPGNQPESAATGPLAGDVNHQGLSIEELCIDRGYLASFLVNDVLNRGGDVVCKPWPQRNNQKGLFTKADFTFNMREYTVECPAGHSEQFELGTVVQFPSEVCGNCPLRAQCTHAPAERGRSLTIAKDEPLQHRLRGRMATQAGRQRLRSRTSTEHKQAHVAQRQGRRARYKGIRKNVFDLRRVAATINLETIQRKCA